MGSTHSNGLNAARPFADFNNTVPSATHQSVQTEDTGKFAVLEIETVPLPEDRNIDADKRPPEPETETVSISSQHDNPFTHAAASGSTVQLHPMHLNRLGQSTLIPLGKHAKTYSRADEEHSQLVNPFSCDSSGRSGRSIAAILSVDGNQSTQTAGMAFDDSLADDDGIDCENEEAVDDDEGEDDAPHEDEDQVPHEDRDNIAPSSQDGQRDRCEQQQEHSSEPMWTKYHTNMRQETSAAWSTSHSRDCGNTVRGAARTECQYPRSDANSDEWELPRDLEPASCATRMDFEDRGTLPSCPNQDLLLARRAKKLMDVQREIAVLRQELGVSRS